MKKWLIGIILLASGFIYAATVNVPTLAPISVLTAAQVLVTTPTYNSQPIICSNCGAVNGGLGTICIATGTVKQDSWIIAGSSLTAVTNCQ